MRAADWNLEPDQIGVIGFSAGGHLAAMAATKFDLGEGKTRDPIQRESSRPDFAILIYPVITMGLGTHAGSRNNLLGSSPSDELIKLYSNELQVTAKTPPTFLAHAAWCQRATVRCFTMLSWQKKCPPNILLSQVADTA